MARCGSERRPGCGREIVWGLTPEGKKIPLDMQAAVYELGTWIPELQAYAVKRVTGFRANHFNVCPMAKNFTRPPAARDGRKAAAGE